MLNSELLVKLQEYDPSKHCAMFVLRSIVFFVPIKCKAPEYKEGIFNHPRETMGNKRAKTVAHLAFARFLVTEFTNPPTQCKPIIESTKSTIEIYKQMSDHDKAILSALQGGLNMISMKFKKTSSSS